MAPKSQFVLKDSPPEVIEAADVEPKGRTYSKRYATRPGGIHVDDALFGMKMASVAITDDKEDTLKNTSKTNPWQKQAIKIITGSKGEAYKPLSNILSTHFDLQLDTHIDESGFKHGRPIDTQGFIAHNDEVIVLAYRCTTSALDWITNFSTTSSEWEPDVDLEAGHAGYCSCLMGLDLCGPSDETSKPRVHTGFYNNFLMTHKYIKEHIEPLLQPDQPPRKLFVVGHSLGAGIATMAGCYFLLNYEWELLPHKLAIVTAGSPRACQQSMHDVVEPRLNELRHLDKAVFCRIVLNEDVVAKVPPHILGFVHIGRQLYITEDGEFLVNPRKEKTGSVSMEELMALTSENVVTSNEGDEDDDEDTTTVNGVAQPKKYVEILSCVPGPLKDHMPDFYLRPLIKLDEREKAADSVLAKFGVDASYKFLEKAKESAKSMIAKEAPEAPTEDAEEDTPEEAAAEETPEGAEEAAAREVPVEDAAVEDTTTEEAPAKEDPTEGAPAEEAAPVEDSPTDENVTTEESPKEDAPPTEDPVEDAPTDEVTTEESPVEEAPVEESLVSDAPHDEAMELARVSSKVSEAPQEEAGAPSETTANDTAAIEDPLPEAE